MADSPVGSRLDDAAFAGLWLFAAVTLLSIAAQNVFFVAGVLGFAAAWKNGNWTRWKAPREIWWAVPFLLLALVASFASENSLHSLGTWKKWLLVVALWWTPAIANNPSRVRALLGALLFFSALWALGSSLLALSGPFQAWRGGEAFASIVGRWAEAGEWRAVSGSGGYMVMGTGCMLLIALYTALALEDPSWRRPLHLLCLITLGAALLLTQTRGAWAGAAIAVAFLLVARQPRWLWIMGALGLVLFAWPHSPLRQRMAQSVDMSRDSTRERVYMAQAGLGMIRDHPLLGVGDAMESWDGHQGFYRRYLPDGAKIWGTTKDQEHGHLHDDLIQVAAMYGLPALLALLALFARLTWSAWGDRLSKDPLRRGLAWGVLALILAWWINGFAEYNFGSFQSSFTLWFLLGLGLSGKALEKA